MDEQQVLAILDGVPASHRPEVYQALTGGDPTQTPMRCERAGCSNIVTLGNSYSPALFLRHTGRVDVPHHFCDEAQYGQHYYCSLDCAEAGVLTCWHEHIKPKLARLFAEADARRSAASARRGDSQP